MKALLTILLLSLSYQPLAGQKLRGTYFPVKRDISSENELFTFYQSSVSIIRYHFLGLSFGKGIYQIEEGNIHFNFEDPDTLPQYHLVSEEPVEKGMRKVSIHLTATDGYKLFIPDWDAQGVISQTEIKAYPNEGLVELVIPDSVQSGAIILSYFPCKNIIIPLPKGETYHKTFQAKFENVEFYPANTISSYGITEIRPFSFVLRYNENHTVKYTRFLARWRAKKNENPYWKRFETDIP